ncbi:MAG: hypothetical protein ACI8RZ_004919 [Myxococcota bacterium]|jgi:hypothetical protein
MKSTSALTLALLGAVILACSGMETTEEPITTPTPDVTTDAVPAGLTGVWAETTLPWSGGELVAVDDSTLFVSWGTSTVTTVNSSYNTALSGDGWTGMELLTDSDMVVTAYTKGGTNIGMMVLADEGTTYAYLEDLSKVEDSAVESARAGKRPGMSGRRGGKRGKRGKKKNR